MTDGDCCTTKLDELDRLLNDPDLPLQPDLIWSLLDEVIRADVPAVVAWCRMLLSKSGRAKWSRNTRGLKSWSRHWQVNRGWCLDVW